MTIHYIIYILLLLLFLPFHYWCDWFMRTRNIDLRYMFIIVMCAFGVVATWTYMYECTCTYKMLRLCSQWRVSTLLYSFVIRNWRIGFICSDIIILRCMNVTNKANMCFAYGQSVLTSSRWRRLFGCCCCCGGFFFFAPSFVLYLIYVVSRSIGVRNRNAIYTYICWSSILAWPTINTVCLFPALYHTILYFYSVVVCASNDSSYTSDCSVQFLNVYFLFGGAQEYCESKRVRQALCKCAPLHGVRMRHNESNQLKCRE